MTVSLSNKMEIVIRPRNEIFNHEYNTVYTYMEKVQRTIELILRSIRKLRPESPDTEIIFETSNDDTDRCIHDFEVIEVDEIRNVVAFQCCKCRILGSARMKT